MKQKRLPFANALLLKLHILAFAAFTVMLWMSVIATFNYPGNAEGSFEVFKLFLVERMSVNIFWGLILLMHLGLHQFQNMLQMRAYRTHINSINHIQENYGQRLADDFNSDEITVETLESNTDFEQHILK